MKDSFDKARDTIRNKAAAAKRLQLQAWRKKANERIQTLRPQGGWGSYSYRSAPFVRQVTNAQTFSRLMTLGNIDRMVMRRSEELGARVNFGNPNSVPSVNMQSLVINLPVMGTPCTDEEFIQFQHAYIHEPIHISPDRAGALEASQHRIENLSKTYGVETAKVFHGIWNLIEDSAMEKQHCARYFGDLQVISASTGIFIRNMTDKFHEGAVKGLSVAQKRNDMALMLVDMRSRSSWDRHGTAGVQPLWDAVPDNIRKIADDLSSKFQQRYDAVLKPVDVVDLALAIFNHLYKEELDKKGKLTKRSQNYNLAEEMNPSGAGTPIRLDDGTPINGMGRASAIQEADTNSTPQGQKWKKGRVTNNKTVDGTNSNEAHSKGLTGSGKERWSPMPSSHMEFHKMKSTDAGFNRRLGRPFSVGGMTSDIQATANKLIRKLKVKSRVQRSGAQESGKLQTKSLHTLCNKGTMTTKLFSRKVRGEKIDISVMIMVDNSGSMMGNKNRVAAESAVFIKTVLEDKLRIPVNITYFGGNSSKVKHLGIKDFHEKVDTEVLLSRTRQAINRQAGNADGDSILFATRTILKQPTKRKLIVVISDGNPCASFSGGDERQGLQYVIDAVRKGTEVELLGLGIMDSAPQQFYGKDSSVIVQETEEVPKALLELIGEKL